MKTTFLLFLEIRDFPQDFRWAEHKEVLTICTNGTAKIMRKLFVCIFTRPPQPHNNINANVSKATLQLIVLGSLR